MRGGCQEGRGCRGRSWVADWEYKNRAGGGKNLHGSVIPINIGNTGTVNIITNPYPELFYLYALINII